jgi:hypothetical protein
MRYVIFFDQLSRFGAVRSTPPSNETEKRSAAPCSRLHFEPQNVRSLTTISVTALRSSLSDRRESPTRKSLVTSHAGDSIRVSTDRARLPGCNKATERHRGIVRYLDGSVRVSDSCKLERPDYFVRLKMNTIHLVPLGPSTFALMIVA